MTDYLDASGPVPLGKSDDCIYGYCPVCGAEAKYRERRLNGNDICTNGHEYPSANALKHRPAETNPVRERLGTKDEGL